MKWGHKLVIVGAVCVLALGGGCRGPQHSAGGPQAGPGPNGPIPPGQPGQPGPRQAEGAPMGMPGPDGPGPQGMAGFGGPAMGGPPMEVMWGMGPRFGPFGPAMRGPGPMAFGGPGMPGMPHRNMMMRRHPGQMLRHMPPPMRDRFMQRMHDPEFRGHMMQRFMQHQGPGMRGPGMRGPGMRGPGMGGQEFRGPRMRDRRGPDGDAGPGMQGPRDRRGHGMNWENRGQGAGPRPQGGPPPRQDLQTPVPPATPTPAE